MVRLVNASGDQLYPVDAGFLEVVILLFVPLSQGIVAPGIIKKIELSFYDFVGLGIHFLFFA